MRLKDLCYSKALLAHGWRYQRTPNTYTTPPLHPHPRVCFKIAS
jgi:hypothetical protein